MLLTVRLFPGGSRGPGTRPWPVGGWAGPSRTRSSTCSCTGEEKQVQGLQAGADADVLRTDKATLTAQYQTPDDRPGDVDAFAREPFVVRFRAPKTGEVSGSSWTMRTGVTSAPPPQPSGTLS